MKWHPKDELFLTEILTETIVSVWRALMPQKRLYWRLGAFDDLELALSLQLEPDLEDVKIVVRLKM